MFTFLHKCVLSADGWWQWRYRVTVPGHGRTIRPASAAKGGGLSMRVDVLATTGAGWGAPLPQQFGEE